ncbi:cupin domain-containing protein [Aeromicrobium fastidiosum]|uniref:cupin domain-containing protein n=1 Tax=Aeromicrobium fastidiosum TaxID=52699 RepID=UPI0020233E90|nr:cupin domain-containing protein [Aeromicrobium fastidiosum]MCL8251458.1 cupin domain-containing protein [Aeromicrobium fastidiosum]
MTQRPPLAEMLDLQPHPEGGWYRRTWASDVEVTLPDGRVRPTATTILFLLPSGESSAWHRVASDELWIAQHGSVRLELGGTGGRPAATEVVVVGLDLGTGDAAQVLVPAGVWQRTVPSSTDALVGCVVSPGFDFDDFELADDA